ncbi:MAG: ParA family protein [Kineosporiaceae bacterium]
MDLVDETYSRVADDSRHVVGGTPSLALAPSIGAATAAALPPTPAGIVWGALPGWAGAAPAVTAVGLAWPGSTSVSRGTVVLESEDRQDRGGADGGSAVADPLAMAGAAADTARAPADTGATNGAHPAPVTTSAPQGAALHHVDLRVAREAGEPGPDRWAPMQGLVSGSAATGGSYAAAAMTARPAGVPAAGGRDVPGIALRPAGAATGGAHDEEVDDVPLLVSRETSTVAGDGGDRSGTHGVRDVDETDDGGDDTRKSSAVAGTGQTSPVQAEQGEDGSARMQPGSSVVGGVRGGADQSWGAPTTASYGYEDRHRVDLVQSLPTVDDSTPLAVEVAEDARRRISLVGRAFPAPPRTRILTVANQKGGVGKTTTTVNVAAAMAQSGLNVLVLDIDPQGNASTALGIDHHSEIPSLYDVVVERRPLSQVLQSCPEIPNLYCAPATIDMAGAEIELVSLVAREVRLQKALRDYLDERESQGQPRIDYVFVDCPPSLSLLTVNAFVAADEVFIPIQCEYYALEGLSQLLKHVELIRGHLNPTLHVSSILLTMYDGRTRLSSQVADEVRGHFPETVLRTTVPRSVRISEAPSHGQTVMTYDPASSGALSYLEAARELAEQVLTWADSSQQEERA